MRIYVLDAPLGCEFRTDVAYKVHGVFKSEIDPETGFVFDEEGEMHFLSDLDWEEVKAYE